MTLALIVAKPGLTITLQNNAEVPLFGYGANTSTETNTQASCTEGATFSELSMNIISGGSGTNNLRFRDAGANGNQLATIAGTGIARDATNTDVLTAGDLFNLAYTDNGSDSTISWITANVEFASGYGSFQGCAAGGGAVFDVESSTRFTGLSGSLGTDGSATEANEEFRIRGFTTFEAMQVRVAANARGNNSVFRNRIDGGNGSAVITFAGGATGLVVDDGLADAIADGNEICASITLDTGVEDLTVAFICATLKSTNTKQDIWCRSVAGLARTASVTQHYFPIGGVIPALTDLTEAQARVRPGFAGVASNLRCYLSANTYASSGTLILMLNGSGAITTTITGGGGAGWYENTSDTVAFDDDDEISFEFHGGGSGSITIFSVGITLAPTVAGGFVPYPRPRGLTGGMSNWGGGMQV